MEKRPLRRASLWRLTLDHRTRVQEPCIAGLQPHPPDCGSVRRPRNPAVAVPEAGAWPRQRPSQLPAGVRRRRRALRPLQLHRPAGAHAAARQRLRRRRDHRGRHRWPGGRARPRQPAGLRRRLPAALQGGAAPGAAALLRRAGRLLRLRRGAPHREEAGEDLPARHAGLPGHPAAAVRGAGGHRQPVGQAVPDRLCRPGATRGLQQRQEAAARAQGAAEVLGERAAGAALGRLSGRARVRQGRLPEGGGARQGADRRRRLHAGAGRPADQEALHRVAAVAVPGAALAQSQPLHVLLRLRRVPGGGRLAGDPGAPGAGRAGPQDHHPPAGRHPAARAPRRSRTRRSSRNWSTTPRSAPST